MRENGDISADKIGNLILNRHSRLSTYSLSKLTGLALVVPNRKGGDKRDRRVQDMYSIPFQGELTLAFFFSL
jgi:hypothetical protein